MKTPLANTSFPPLHNVHDPMNQSHSTPCNKWTSSLSNSTTMLPPIATSANPVSWTALRHGVRTWPPTAGDPSSTLALLAVLPVQAQVILIHLPWRRRCNRQNQQASPTLVDSCYGTDPKRWPTRRVARII